MACSASHVLKWLWIPQLQSRRRVSRTSPHRVKMPSERRRERRSPNPLGYKFRRSLPAVARLFRSSAGKQPGCPTCHDAFVPKFWGEAAVWHDWTSDVLGKGVSERGYLG